MSLYFDKNLALYKRKWSSYSVWAFDFKVSSRHVVYKNFKLQFFRTNRAILRSVYVESLDLLILASEDGNIYLWGFDVAAVSALEELEPETAEPCQYDRLVKEQNFALQGFKNTCSFVATYVMLSGYDKTLLSVTFTFKWNPSLKLYQTGILDQKNTANIIRLYGLPAFIA